VTVNLVWPLPNPDNRVEWSIWTTPIDPVANVLREGFKPLVAPLGSTVQFTGHSFIYNGQDWGCVVATGLGPCGNQCVNSGRYCAPDPDGDLFAGHSGGDVVLENLRQLCIFQQANATVATDFGIRYWNYVNLWYTNCEQAADWAACSVNQQLAAMLNPANTSACYLSSNSTTSTENVILEKEMQLRENYFIVTLPTFVVNEQVLRGKPTPVSILSTICNGFATTTPPVCLCTAVSSDWLSTCATQGIDAVPVADGGRKQPPVPGGMPSYGIGLIVFLIIIVAVIIVAGVYAYRRAHHNMQSMLDDYRQLQAEEHTDDAGL